MTLSRKNIHKQARQWFRKLKKALSLLSDSTVIILLAAGYADDSFTILVIRVGVSASLNTLEIFLSDEENA
jgi:hypothetical protein